jgi:hypothetical protein
MKRLVTWLYPLSSWLFICCAILFTVSQLLQFTGNAPEWVSGYVDDLVVMPIILTLALIGIRLLSSQPDFELPRTYLVAAFLVVSIAFEWWIPLRSPHFTSDWLDVLCYGAGTLAFYLSGKRTTTSQF